MRKPATILSSLAIIMSLAVTAVSCAIPTPIPGPESPTPTAETGTLQILVTDAPPKDEVTSILITVSKVQIHKATAEQEREQNQTGDQVRVQQKELQKVQEGEEEWISIELIAGKNTFDLLKIKGIEELLGESKVDAGKYTQVRLSVDKAEVGLGGGTPKPAKVPSGELKIVHPFDVVAGETTALVLDFDAEKSVNIAGKDKVMVKPVIKLSVKSGKPAGKDEKPAATTEEESLMIAEDFVKKEATFAFDGIPDTLKMADSEQLRTSTEWQFTFEFDSRQAGYGDRTGQVLAQVITHHRAVITVNKGRVTHAVMDDKWDMLKQQEIAAAGAAANTSDDGKKEKETGKGRGEGNSKK